jgi:class 3 adenylate cyclase/tetratricopeptide (TPR) repeat protein
MKSFEEVLDQAAELLRRQGKVSFRALKRQFSIDDDFLEDIIFELTEVKNIAVVEKDIMLVLVEQKEVAKPIQKKEEQEAERRQMTMMFIDLVGSTPLSRILDPEDFANVLYEYQKIFDSIVKKYGGKVVQLLGDGIMSYFGHPIAHEDDPIRAVLSGLEMMNSLNILNRRIKKELDVSIQVRIGIHTGLVVIGTTEVKGHTKTLALGEAPNMAARIQGAAQPNSILISPTTYRLVKNSFNIASTGNHLLKGFDEPMELFAILDERNELLNNDRDQQYQTQFVGRKWEKAKIINKWVEAKRSKGQIILVNGIAGIGKSRLVNNVISEITEDGVQVIKFYCSPYNKNTFFYPIVNRLKNIMSLEQKESPEILLHKLKSFLESVDLHGASDLALLADLLNVENDHIQKLNVSSDVQRNLTHNLLTRWLLKPENPLIILFEDLHWTDPTTLEFVKQLFNQINQYPVLCVATYRPDFTHKLPQNKHTTEIVVKRLKNSEAQSIIQQIAHKLPPEILQDLLNKTDGNPLFVEEVTKFIIESGLLDKINSEDNTEFSIKNISIPSTLHDSLMARLDRLGNAKKVAQMGATIGRQFSFDLIKSISNLPEKILLEHLNSLIDAQMLFVKGTLPNVIYTFKHALLQDAAYNSLLKKNRQEIHKTIVKVLEKQKTTAISTPELLAHHYTEAGLLSASIPLWQSAGERAISRSAHHEAINHLRNGLNVLSKIPDSPEKIHQEIFFHLSLGVPYTVLMGYGSPEVEKAYGKAQELCHKVGESVQLVPALYGLWRHYLLRGNYNKAEELSLQLIELAENSGDIMYLNVARRAAGSTAFYIGKLEKASYYLERIVQKEVSYEKHAESLLYDVIDMWVAAYSYLSWTYWLQGKVNKAIESSEAAIELAHKLNHPFSIALSLCFASWLHQFRGDHELTVTTGQKGLQIAELHGFKFWHGWANLMMHWVGDINGEKGNLELIEKDLQDWFSTGSRLGTSYFLYLRSERYLAHGNISKCKTYLKEAIKFTEERNERFWEPEISRLQGELYLKMSPPDYEKASEAFQKSYHQAMDMKAKSLAIKAAISLAEITVNEEINAEAKSDLQALVDSINDRENNKDVHKALEVLSKS